MILDELGLPRDYEESKAESELLEKKLEIAIAALQYIAADDLAIFDCPSEVRSYLMRARKALREINNYCVCGETSARNCPVHNE